MTIRKTIVAALSGAAIVAASQAQAQLSAYNQDDLLLNFRSATTPTTADVVVDLGNVNTFVTTVEALPGGTAVLDTVSGVTPTAGYTTKFTASGLLGVEGTPASGNQVGFSAAASDQNSEEIWLTRAISSPGLTPGTASQQVSTLNQGKTVNLIAGIGNGGLAGTALTGGASGSTAVVASGGTHSYQTEAEASTTLTSLINYQATQSTASPAGGLIESLQSGSADIYEALWSVPETGNGTPSFDGYFTFAPDGEVDFTAQATAVPEPATYGMLAGLGLLALAARRQFRSLTV